MKRIYLTLPDGRVRKISPDVREGETEDARILRSVKRNKEVGMIPDGADFVILDDSEVPGPEFRDGWKLVNGKIGHDLDKCREITRKRFLATQRANDRAAEALRDQAASQAIDAAKSPDELKAIQAQGRLSR